MRDAEVDVTLPKPLQVGRVGGSRAAVDAVVERVVAIIGIVVS